MRLPSMAEMLASLSITCSFCQRTVGRGMKLYEIVNVFEGDVNLVIGEMKNRLQQHIGCTCSGYAKGSLSSADITDACLATLIHYWGETGEITPEHAWECINNEKEKAETQRKHAHEIFALEKAGAGDATADDANDAHEGGEQRIKRRRKKPGASPAAALTDIMGKQGNNAMAASSSSTSGMQMTTLKACTGAMVQPKGTYPAAPDPGHVAQASQALQTALSAAMDGSRSRGTVTITQVIRHADAEPHTQVERVDKIRELLNGVEDPKLVVKVLAMVQTKIATIRKSMTAKKKKKEYDEEVWMYYPEMRSAAPSGQTSLRSM
jgi:hypothetical protein